ncbi:MAG TPA: hypothetical protein VGH11_11670 [Jatrophihabitans sp.]
MDIVNIQARTATAMAAQPTPLYCGQCGQPLGGDHYRCASRSELEPPRFCAHCARRMVVQVTPVGWHARCSRHGVFSG